MKGKKQKQLTRKNSSNKVMLIIQKNKSIMSAKRLSPARGFENLRT